MMREGNCVPDSGSGLCSTLNCRFLQHIHTFERPQKVVIFDFYHKCQKSEMTVDCVDDFIYPVSEK
jgi:hypothetical protein